MPSEITTAPADPSRLFVHPHVAHSFLIFFFFAYSSGHAVLAHSVCMVNAQFYSQSHCSVTLPLNRKEPFVRDDDEVVLPIVRVFRSLLYSTHLCSLFLCNLVFLFVL